VLAPYYKREQSQRLSGWILGFLNAIFKKVEVVVPKFKQNQIMGLKPPVQKTKIVLEGF
jgi:hypothetical protein